MKKILIILGIVAIAFVIGIVSGANKTKVKSGAQKRLTQFSPNAQLSPFTAVRFDGDKVMVTYDGSEYELSAIDDLQISDLLNFCRDKYKDAWQKRFAEDLVVVFSDMGHPINADHTVSLALIDSKTGEMKNIAHATMTEENRQTIHDALTAKQ